jgi:hypothetical protein
MILHRQGYAAFYKAVSAREVADWCLLLPNKNQTSFLAKLLRQLLLLLWLLLLMLLLLLLS